MLLPVQALVFALATMGVAQAQAPNLARDALATFADVCLSTNSAPDAVAAKLTEYGWNASSFEDLPAAPSARRTDSVIVIAHERADDTRVFSMPYANGMLFVHSFTRTDGRQRVPACQLYAAGANEAQIGQVIFPTNEEARASFMVVPGATLRANGRPFNISVAPIAPLSPHAELHSIAVFSAQSSQ